jgi:hypothetical protein
MPDMTPEGLRAAIRRVNHGGIDADGSTDTDRLMQLFSAFADEIVGGNEDEARMILKIAPAKPAFGIEERRSYQVNRDTERNKARNQLRAEQRARKAHLIGKESV